MVVRLLPPNGKLLHVICTGQVVLNQVGTPIRLWGTVQDITEQSAMRAAHQEAVRAAETARAALETEHAALQMVQRALLPGFVPTFSGVELAVVYQPMENVADVGGDWYDAFHLPDGRLAISVGDVAGHDLRAARVMGIRSAIRAYAMEDPCPGEVLRRANHLLMALGGSDLVTAIFGVYDQATHDLTFARAGHPQPLARVGGRTEVLDDPRGILLGAIPVACRYAEHRLVMQPGDALLLYTDGLVERRGQDTTRTIGRLCRLVDAVRGRPTPSTSSGW